MSEHTPLTEAEVALVPLLPMDPARSDVIAWAEAILAARTSTATAECEDCTQKCNGIVTLLPRCSRRPATGLRERVEALLRGPAQNVSKFALSTALVTPASTECPSRCGRNDPCPDRWHDAQERRRRASTEDRADNEGTP